MNKINWGILGLGEVAQKFSEGFKETSNAKLLAISSKNDKKLKKFKDQFNIENKYSFNNYEELINCKDLDIVYISLPNSFHHEWSIKSIENNKNVLVEKPATLNLKQAHNINLSLKDKNLFYGEAFMYRYHPQINLLLKIIKNNEIGNLVSMKSSFGVNLLTKKKFFFFNKKKKINPQNRLFNKELGGGCILDLGCYPISFSLLIGSMITNTVENKFKISDIRKEINETFVDIDAQAKISLENGFFSEISSSFKKNLGENSEIKGEKGKILIKNTWSGSENIIKINNKNISETIKIENRKNIYSYQIQNVSQSIIDGVFSPQYPGMSLKETLINMELINEWLNA